MAIGAIKKSSFQKAPGPRPEAQRPKDPRRPGHEMEISRLQRTRGISLVRPELIAERLTRAMQVPAVSPTATPYIRTLQFRFRIWCSTSFTVNNCIFAQFCRSMYFNMRTIEWYATYVVVTLVPPPRRESLRRRGTGNARSLLPAPAIRSDLRALYSGDGGFCIRAQRDGVCAHNCAGAPLPRTA